MLIILAVVLVNLASFFAVGSLIHVLYHVWQRDRAKEWKHQPGKFQSVRQIADKIPLVLVNGLVLNTGLGLGIWAAFSGWTQVRWSVADLSLFQLVVGSLALPLWYHLMLFYVHRAMHHPWLFRRVHYLHHHDKAPMFLDALYEHPIEAAWGAVVLTSPLFLWPVYWWAYVAFFSIVGLHEILDHTGVAIDLPILSKSKGHDEHHRRSNCYYGQLLPLLDWIHRTDRPGKGHAD